MSLWHKRAINDWPFWQTFGNNDGLLRRTDANVRVTHDTALTDDAVLAAVSLLAGTIANLPWKAFSTDGDLTQPLPVQPSWLEMPDPLDRAITAGVHKTQVALSLLLAGNAYIWCQPNVLNPLRLTVMDPTRVRVYPSDRGGREFRVTDAVDIDASDPRNVVKTFGDDQILHVPYLLRPGRLTGLSPIEAQTGNIGISLALRKWIENFFGGGGQVSGFVVLPPDAGEPAIAETEKRISRRLSGWRNAGRIGVLSGGANWMKTGLTPQDADLGNLWLRQLEVAARVFGIPPFMIGSQEPGGIAYASTVERSQHYIDYCVMRYTRPIEEAYSRLGLPEPNTEVRFNFNALLRGDPKARWEAYGVALDKRARKVDEIRALENLAPFGEDGGGFLNTPNNQVSDPKWESLGALVRAGFDPEAALAALGLPPIKHTGLVPVTVQGENVATADTSSSAAPIAGGLSK